MEESRRKSLRVHPVSTRSDCGLSSCPHPSARTSRCHADALPRDELRSYHRRFKGPSGVLFPNANRSTSPSTLQRCLFSRDWGQGHDASLLRGHTGFLESNGSGISFRSCNSKTPAPPSVVTFFEGEDLVMIEDRGNIYNYKGEQTEQEDDDEKRDKGEKRAPEGDDEGAGPWQNSAAKNKARPKKKVVDEGGKKREADGDEGAGPLN
ncbi:hypothetical protein BDK51DRAFT_32400 [Blyttiomyces helicus]|uniref:Uncharacterized protein n=1 Tax=Blyttiomyces helicus TaxID=388810 RepID=A0A4P9WGH9_9FUNG|nr:hypothetical protein BDK51DRAFT_32400 [Blyttiomyces helicus]|eukprot:RKO90923.1 hypothetical protein BDK51DRAFT_32400 [Blyttiomyces helicus]